MLIDIGVVLSLARIGQAHRADVMITTAARIAKPCRVMPPSVTLGV